MNAGSDFVEEKLPASPDIELTRTNKEETAAARFASAQPSP